MKPLADVIDIAINEHLWEGIAPLGVSCKQRFSCNAIHVATKCEMTATYRAWNFIRELGVVTDSTLEFSKFPHGEKRQYARAMWLTWAAMIAREEGL